MVLPVEGDNDAHHQSLDFSRPAWRADDRYPV